VLAEVINKNSDKTGVRASWQVQSTGVSAVAGGDIKGLTINGITIGDIKGIKANDSDGKLVAAINAVKDQTGVEAFIVNRGNLNLKSIDGRGIKISGAGLDSVGGFAKAQDENYGRLTLTRLDARDIVVEGTQTSGAGFEANVAESTINLRSIRGAFTADQASAMGAHANANVENNSAIGAGVTTLRGAMAVMDIAESAQKMLDKIRSDLGSVQNQLTSTINNISVTQVNVKAAESQIRDVDFAAESANFNKHNLLAQSGSYAMSQANAVQQNVMRLLQ
jgi:flagellin